MLSASLYWPWLLSLLAAATAGPGWRQPHRLPEQHPSEPLPEVPSALDMPLLRQVTSDPAKNEAISPFVVSSLMSQVFLGTGGTTSAEMRPFLGVGEEHDTAVVPEYLDGYQAAIDHLSSENSNVTVAVFNRMYVRRGFSVRPTYGFTLREAYGSDTRTIYSPEQAANDINTDVAKVTRNKIQDLVSTRQLQDAVLVLVSALYFKGLWQHPFEPAGKGRFLTPDGERQVDMMLLDSTRLLYADLGTFQAAALPYEDPDYCLLLLRPSERNMASAQALLDILGTLNITDIVGHMFPKKLEVTMPKFKIETEYSLVDQLRALGIQEVFTRSADLSGMTEQKNVYVSDVIHKVFIEVTEEGTEAAGAGAAVVTTFSFPRPPLRFVLDRPFFAVVYNKRRHLNLFASYVASPKFDTTSGHA